MEEKISKENEINIRKTLEYQQWRQTELITWIERWIYLIIIFSATVIYIKDLNVLVYFTILICSVLMSIINSYTYSKRRYELWKF